MNVNQLSPGEKAEILEFTDHDLGLVLNDLGLFAGEIIEFTGSAPLGDPICIKTEETLVSIRKEDAYHIIINKEII